VNDALASCRTDAGSDPKSPRVLAMLAPWRLQIVGYALAAFYAATFLYRYKAGTWLVNGSGAPRLNDFVFYWVAGAQALHGNTAGLFDPAALVKLQQTVVGTGYPEESFFLTWPYPPIFLLLMAPLALLSPVAAFLSFQAVTFVACAAVVFLIVRRSPSVALLLASPFTAINVNQGQTGFLMASLVGAALFMLERRPWLAGVLIGCITYKPQFGILLPVALLAARQWRALTGAAITAAALAAVSIAAFGTAPWEEFPHQLLAQSHVILLRQSPWGAQWALIPTVYGLARALHGSAPQAWLAQAIVAAGAAALVWIVWRSSARYALKAALLAAALLLATPYGWPHDLTVIVIPLAFLASDQMRYGLLRGEQAVEVALFGVAVAMLFTLGGMPGPIMMTTLLVLTIRRVLCAGRAAQPAVAG
jgi:arabinofuranan 3-O-arabinosyltransferase